MITEQSKVAIRSEIESNQIIDQLIYTEHKPNTETQQ